MLSRPFSFFPKLVFNDSCFVIFTAFVLTINFFFFLSSSSKKVDDSEKGVSSSKKQSFVPFEVLIFTQEVRI